MELYMAPMEGLTGYIFRNAYQEYFGGINKYFAPFVSGRKLGTKGKNDLMPEHNKGIQIIPQILTNNAREFISISNQIKEKFGYQEINLNLGCPAGTVVAKNRGSGFLGVLDQLDQFLEQIFEQSAMEISIKTRIGMENVQEWENIIKIYNKYPLKELIVHPRLQKEFYKGVPHYEIYQLISENTSHSLCYNGDIRDGQDYQEIMHRFPNTTKIMIGRGLIKNPNVINEIYGQKKMGKDILKEFHNYIYQGYQVIMSGERNTLYRMKEFWSYFIEMFVDANKYLKKIRKAESFEKYEQVIEALFEELEINI